MKRKRNAKESKEAIIRKAVELFSTKGYDSTSMDELATESGLSKAMIFYYFKSKRELYEEVLCRVLDEIYEAVTKKSDTRLDAREELNDFISIYIDFAYAHPYLPSLLLKELSDNGSILPEILFSKMRRLFSHFSEILSRGEADGSFRESKAMVLYFMVTGTINLMVTTSELRKRAYERDETLDTCSECNRETLARELGEKIVSMLRSDS